MSIVMKQQTATVSTPGPKAKPTTSSKTLKGLRRKEPRLCYSVKKAGKDNSNSQASVEEPLSKRGGSQSKAARRSASIHGVSRARVPLVERSGQRQHRKSVGDGSPIHSELQSKNSCLNAVEMNMANDPSTMSSAGKSKSFSSNGTSAGLRTFTSSTSGYGSLIDSTLEELATFSALPKSTPRQPLDEPCKDRTASSDTTSNRRQRLQFLLDSEPHDDDDDDEDTDCFIIEDLLSALSDKLRRISSDLREPLLRRSLAGVEFDIHDLRVRCQATHKRCKDNKILRKRIAFVQVLFEEERVKSITEKKQLMAMLHYSHEENQLLTNALRQCIPRDWVKRSDATTQTSPEMKDATTEMQSFEVEVSTQTEDKVLTTPKATSLRNNPERKDNSKFLRDFKKKHDNCHMEKTSTALNEIVDSLERVPAERPGAPASVSPSPTSVKGFLRLTKENLFHHERRYSQHQISSAQAPVKSKAKTEIRQSFDNVSDCTLVDAGSSCGQAIHVVDTYSAASRFSSSTVSSLKSKDHRDFEERMARLHNRFLQFDQNAPHFDDVTACAF